MDALLSIEIRSEFITFKLILFFSFAEKSNEYHILSSITKTPLFAFTFFLLIGKLFNWMPQFNKYFNMSGMS